MSTHIPLIIIYGPTASGKTDLSYDLAEYLENEPQIINADLGQCYTPCTIGTAKPVPPYMRAIPHHLFNIIDEPQNISVATYQEKCLLALEQAYAQGGTPVIVGGSGFYIKSLFFPFTHKSPQLQAPLRIHQDTTWEELHRVDPLRASQIHPNDTYRITQALSLWHTTHKLPSEHKPTWAPVSRSIKIIYTHRDRADLYNRINTRTRIMIQNGWFEEIKNLASSNWNSFLQTKKLIGYDDLLKIAHLDHVPEKVTEEISQKTRHYAKRQITFWNSLKKNINTALESNSHYNIDIIELNLSNIEPENYKKQLRSIAK
ncbi:hypothetical protein J120_03670 [candidate division TM6 bacterium JCVI TM6SC1]|uniref:tRNA dimethylallyltransferase n=1 Tax=candidate division TM6 bacterium JCVI TM6SC1 TaxID=1306947 RepID=A0A0D2GNP9_9BACT|nr:hypothetical protein J120_03670 [candidate division TM6 bacterium JCVI TM6SC1]